MRMGPNDASLAEISISQSASLPKAGYVNPFDLQTAQSNLSVAAQHVLDQKQNLGSLESQSKSTSAIHMDVTGADKASLENY